MQYNLVVSFCTLSKVNKHKMTNAAKDKQVNSRVFYGKWSKITKSTKFSKGLYFTPAERKALKDRKKILKSQAEVSVLPKPQNNTSDDLDLLHLVKDNSSVTEKSNSNLPVYSIFDSPTGSTFSKSPHRLEVLLPGTAKTRRIANRENQSPKTQQLIIDAGQKKIGACQCELCGMVYTVNLPYDQQQHAVHHKRFLDNVKFLGWKNERVVASCLKGRILKIFPSDPKYALKKAKEICTLIDVDLGFENRLNFETTPSKIVYLFISNEYQVAGCLVAEPLTSAFRLVSDSADHHIVSTVSRNAVPVVCGISRLWTYYPYRRQGIATQLVNAVRNTFVLGCQLEKDQIAFSDPTPDGIKFASRYFQSKEFLTYNFSN